MPDLKKIFLETSKLKNLNSGLGQFCQHLGLAIIKKNVAFDLTFCLPDSAKGIFGNTPSIIQSKLNRLFGYSVEADLWHYFHQGTFHLPKGKKTKMVVTVHDLNFTLKYSGWKLKKELWVLQHQLSRADAIIAISEYTRKEILRHLEVDEKKISVIYNGATMPDVQPKRPSFVDSKKFFFALGIISSKKNFRVLIPLLKEIEGKLIIAGNNSGGYTQQILADAQDLGVRDKLVLPGEVSEEEKLWLFQNCEAFLFPSVAEGFGLPVIEAMREGKPVFISNLTSLPEVGGPHAYYFNNFEPSNMREVLDSGLKDFYAKPEKKKEIQNWASRFSWEKAAEQYLEIYRLLLS